MLGKKKKKADVLIPQDLTIHLFKMFSGILYFIKTIK